MDGWKCCGADAQRLGRLAVAAAGWLSLCAGCVATGRVETAGADLLDLVAKQTESALNEYERDLEAIDADRRKAVVQSLAERVKRDGAETVDAHCAAVLEALEKIEADRQVARQRYQAAVDNVDVMRDVAGGLRRYGDRLSRFNGQWQGMFGGQ